MRGLLKVRESRIATQSFAYVCGVSKNSRQIDVVFSSAAEQNAREHTGLQGGFGASIQSQVNGTDAVGANSVHVCAGIQKSHHDVKLPTSRGLVERCVPGVVACSCEAGVASQR